MPRGRILVVDDSVVIRHLLSKCLERDPELEVAGSAPNGKIALAKINQINPDLVILDIEMPVMDGLETLSQLRKTHPALPVIMFSTLTQRGASATLDALSLGANDYLSKPQEAGGIDAALEQVARELIPKIKTLCGLTPAMRPSTSPASSRAVPTPDPGTGPAAKVGAVVIGVSTGGPNALAEVLPALPESLRVPVLVVQHMPPTFTGLLAERLNGKCALQVRECIDGKAVEAGTIWIARGDYHMALRKEGLRVFLEANQDAPENSCRPAADVLFRSAVQVWGAGTLGVVLTGMGSDGLRGSKLIHERGGRVLAQNEASSVVWGMPGYVARANIAEAILPLDKIAPEIVRQVSGDSRPAARRLAASTDHRGR